LGWCDVYDDPVVPCAAGRVRVVVEKGEKGVRLEFPD